MSAPCSVMNAMVPPALTPETGMVPTLRESFLRKSESYSKGCGDVSRNGADNALVTDAKVPAPSEWKLPAVGTKLRQELNQALGFPSPLGFEIQPHRIRFTEAGRESYPTKFVLSIVRREVCELGRDHIRP